MGPGDAPTRRREGARTSAPWPRLGPGSIIGRYVVVRFVGAGGNGEVYAAYDQVLRRTIALKLLRASGGDGDVESAARGWPNLLEEAQALAKLSHPNVVGVHDVGQAEDLVFIAMELVEGADLRVWRTRCQPAPSWREIASVVLEAGRGLAAAHADGIVHGDFKPSNVLVDGGGRVRVVDFGLSRIQTSESTDVEASSVQGTPSYMAPEQHHGRASAFSDQFGFAATMFELLTGSVPFHGATTIELLEAKEDGDIEPVALERLPRRLRPAILRALSATPSSRFSDLDALLDELRRCSRPAPWTRWGVGSAAAAVLATVWAVSGNDDSASCRGIEAELDDVWNEDRREQIRAAFSSTERAYVPDVLRSVERELDGYAARWLSARGALCEQQESASALERRAYVLRRLCLDARRTALDTAVAVLSTADASVVTRSLEVTRGLGPIESCATVELRTPRRPIPTAEDLPALEVIESDLAKLNVLRAAGRYEEARALAISTAKRAASLGDATSEAMAWLETADLENRSDEPSATETFHQALSVAIRAGHNEVMAKVSASLAWKAADAAELEQARRWLQHAQAAMDAFGDDDRLLAYVENARGHVHGIAGELEPEIEAHERMLAAVERAHGPDTEPVAVALSGLAIAAYRQGDYARTANLASKALEIIERELGPGHPRVASVALTVSGALMSVGRYAEATNMAERARDVALEVYGNEHPTYITIVMNLGTIASYEGRYDVAEMHLRQALAGWVELRGEGDPSVATTRANLGIALHHLDRLEEAREQLYLARQIWTDKFGPEHPRTVFARVALADVAVDEGHAAQAADDLEVCLRVQSETETDPSDIGMTQFALARALWAMDADRDRALELAKAALDSAQDVPGHGLQAQRIQRWLALVRP